MLSLPPRKTHHFRKGCERCREVCRRCKFRSKRGPRLGRVESPPWRNVFCSTSFPLSSTTWVRLTWSSLCPLFKAVPSMTFSNIKRKILGNAENQTQGRCGKWRMLSILQCGPRGKVRKVRFLLSPSRQHLKRFLSQSLTTKILRAPGVKPWTAGWAAQTLPLWYAVPIIYYYFIKIKLQLSNEIWLWSKPVFHFISSEDIYFNFYPWPFRPWEPW